ncbi:MAG: hypothetical protein IKQ72_12100 [Bacteroidaceae bacterium]|nr:hypothetical protein [Bacteroidaceae bacterium]
MKKMILMLVAIMIAACGIKAINIEQPKAAVENNSEYKSPDKFISCINIIIDKWGDKDKTQNTVSRNPESGAIVSKVVIVPFNHGRSPQTFLEADLKKAINAYDDDKECAYNYGRINNVGGDRPPRDYWATFTGEDEGFQEIILSQADRLTYNLVFMEVKNADDPTKRDFYAIKWRKRQEDYDGKVYMITSKRPDLIMRGANTSSEEKAEDVFSSNDKKMYLLYQKTAQEYKNTIDEFFAKLRSTGYGVAGTENYKERERLKKIIDDYTNKYEEVVNKLHVLIMQQK